MYNGDILVNRDYMSSLLGPLFLIGRILLGGYFVYNAIMHFKNLEGMTAYAKMKGVPFARLAVIVTGIMLLLGGLSIISGMFTIIGIGALILFLIPTTFMMHAFWKENDSQARMNEQINFTKNLALLGALMVIAVLFILMFG